MFEERIFKKMRTEKIYFANGVKMKLIKEADGTVRTEVVGGKPVEAKIEVKQVEPKPEPIAEPVEIEQPVEVKLEEQAVQTEEVPESDGGESSSSDEQHDAQPRRKLPGRVKFQR